MAVNFATHWSDEIREVSEELEYQTCTIQIDWTSGTTEVYDYTTGETYPTTPELSALAKRFIDADFATPEEYDEAIETLNTLLDEPTPIEYVTTNGIEHPGIESEAAAIVLEGTSLFVIWNEPAQKWGPSDATSRIYEGAARFIPIRAGTWQGGEAQLNTTTIRAVRLQLSREAANLRIHAGAIVTFIDAPRNVTLLGRTAKVTDDIQGATTASRTITAFMDADSTDTSE